MNLHSIILTAGIVEGVDGTNITVKFMKRSGTKYGTKYSWPSRPDVQTIPADEILCIILPFIFTYFVIFST